MWRGYVAAAAVPRGTARVLPTAGRPTGPARVSARVQCSANERRQHRLSLGRTRPAHRRPTPSSRARPTRAAASSASTRTTPAHHRKARSLLSNGGTPECSHREPLSRSSPDRLHRAGTARRQRVGYRAAWDTVPRETPRRVGYASGHLQHLERNVARRYARRQRVASGRVREHAALAPHLPAVPGGWVPHS